MLCPSEPTTVLSLQSVLPSSLSIGKKLFHLKVGISWCKRLCSSPNHLSGNALTWLWMNIEREENKAGIFNSLWFFFLHRFQMSISPFYWTICRALRAAHETQLCRKLKLWCRSWMDRMQKTQPWWRSASAYAKFCSCSLESGSVSRCFSDGKKHWTSRAILQIRCEDIFW